MNREGGDGDFVKKKVVVIIWLQSVIIDAARSCILLNFQQLDVETTDDAVGLSGGPLAEHYKVLQLHFHWGSDDTKVIMMMMMMIMMMTG